MQVGVKVKDKYIPVIHPSYQNNFWNLVKINNLPESAQARF